MAEKMWADQFRGARYGWLLGWAALCVAVVLSNPNFAHADPCSYPPGFGNRCNLSGLATYSGNAKTYGSTLYCDGIPCGITAAGSCGYAASSLSYRWTGCSADGETKGTVTVNWVHNSGTDFTAAEVWNNDYLGVGSAGCGSASGPCPPQYTHRPPYIIANPLFEIRDVVGARMVEILDYRGGASPSSFKLYACLPPDPCCGMDCDDGNPCTVDSCSNGTCSNRPIVDDGPECDDGNSCTVDTCDPNTPGGCFHYPRNCDDGLYCTIDECKPETAGGCFHYPRDCEDGDLGSVDACDEEKDRCSYSPYMGCDDGNVCTEDFWEPGDPGGCVFVPEPPCDDGSLCTYDFCDPETGCQSKPKRCEAESIADSCYKEGELMSIDGSSSCTCVAIPGSECITGPTCATGCDDGDLCTVDSCYNGLCTNQPIVDDGPECDDGNACTVDSCDPESGGCVYAPRNCDDGAWCTEDTCDPDIGCQSEPLPCDPSEYYPSNSPSYQRASCYKKGIFRRDCRCRVLRSGGCHVGRPCGTGCDLKVCTQDGESSRCGCQPAIPPSAITGETSGLASE